MPESKPIITRIITDGGIFMMPFAIITVTWITAVIRYILNKNRNYKSLFGMILFPIMFCIIALLNTVYHVHHQYISISITGAQDPYLYAQNGLNFSFATILIMYVAFISLIGNALLMLFPIKQK